jgi:predicted dehydrogenase
MKKLKVAVIGWGRSGRDIHGKHLHTDKERFEVVAVVDEIERRREMARSEFGCETYSDYRELFGRKDLDLVVNASYSHQHAPITEDLLNHGFNVLCEKPCAKTEAQVQGMMDAAARSGRMLAIFQQSRLVPYFEKVRQVMDSGILGRIIQISINFNGFARRWDWQSCQSFNAGSLYNTGPHPVDQALALLNYDGMPDVICRMDRVNTFGDAEDYVKLILTAPDRPLIDVEISSCDAYPSFTYKIQGSRGGLKGSMTDIEWRYFNEGEAPTQRLITTPLMDEEGQPLYCEEKLIWTQEQWKSDGPRVFTYAVRRYYDNVYSHLTEGTPLIVTLEQIRQQIAVMERCHQQNPLSRFMD